MSQDLKVARLVDATPEEVFDAFTNPAGQEAFYGQDDPCWLVRSQCDLRVGGVWTVDFGSSPRELYRHRHVFEIIEPLVEMETAQLLDFTRMTGEVVKAMRACPQPIIAAVDGVCAGAGAILAMASDIRLGTPGAKVAFLFNRVGLAGCDMGACAILPRIIGAGRAAELLYTGRVLGGEEAERWGFFNRLATSDTVLAQAQQLAAELAAGPTFASAMTKRMLDMEWAMSVESAIEAEAIAQALCMETEDFARAFRAFAAKQKPVFEGN